MFPFQLPRNISTGGVITISSGINVKNARLKLIDYGNKKIENILVHIAEKKDPKIPNTIMLYVSDIGTETLKNGMKFV